MRRYYAKDTDTLLLHISDEPVVDIVDLDYQTLLELDANGLQVALTIEHAAERGLHPARNSIDDGSLEWTVNPAAG